METLKARRAWSEVFQALNENNFNLRILYPVKLVFKIDGAIKVFHDKQKLKHKDHQVTSTKDCPRNSAHRK
jgi:transcriptional regulator with PAS, ATPase and Fis domain